MMSNLQNKLEGEKLIYKGSDTMWKLNPVLEQLHSHQLPIAHAKLLTKETEYGAEHSFVLSKCAIANPVKS